MSTLTAYRRALLEEIGGGGVYTTTLAGAANGSTLICSTAFTSSPLPSSHLANGWIHVPSTSAPKQQRVTATGLNSANGTITVGNGFGAQIGSLAIFEYSSRMPLIDDGAKSPGISLNQCVNLALRHLVVPDEITVAVATTDDISLTTWVAWLDRAERLVGVLEPSPVASRASIDAAWRVRRAENGSLLTLDAELPKLRLNVPFSTASGNLTLLVRRPAESWIKASGGSWQEDADGLSAEGDEAKPDLNHVVTAGKVFVYQALMQARSGASVGRYADLYADALKQARALPFWDVTRDDLPSPTPPAAVQEAA